MAFKSKTHFNAFDKNNTTVKNLEFNSLKTLTKAGIKKLVAVNGESTPFRLVLDYFKDDKGKAVAHFLDMGTNVKTDKHFEQVEMKPGKSDKRMSGSPKEAASGVMYIKPLNGTDTIHIQPTEKCKIPGGKWPKILKALKPYFSGYPATIVLEAPVETVEENQDQETPNTPATIRAAKMTKLEDNLAVIEKALGIELDEDVV